MAEIYFTSHLRNLVPKGPLSAAGAGEFIRRAAAGARLCVRRQTETRTDLKS
jgi:hypothetical protein